MREIKTMLSPNDLKIIERFKALLREHEVPVCEVILYGSRARGDARADSDYDLLVVVEHNSLDIRNTVSDCAWEVGFDDDIFIQTIVKTRDEIENSPYRSSLFMMAVRQDGIKV